MVTPFAGVWIEISKECGPSSRSWVTPFAGVWIEITWGLWQNGRRLVTPFAGVWIEMYITRAEHEEFRRSLPLRECGLKCPGRTQSRRRKMVTPFAGVWIEIQKAERKPTLPPVTPFAGVWIEMLQT